MVAHQFEWNATNTWHAFDAAPNKLHVFALAAFRHEAQCFHKILNLDDDKTMCVCTEHSWHRFACRTSEACTKLINFVTIQMNLNS